MTNGEWLLESGEDTQEVEPVREVLVEAFKEVEPVAPVLTVREIDEHGQVAFVNRPMLPVAQTERPIKEIAEGAHSTSVPDIISAVAIAAKHPKDMLIGASHFPGIVAARHTAMYLARELIAPPPSYPELGREFNRNHTTVMHAIKSIGTLLASYDPDPKAMEKKRKINEIIERTLKLLEHGYTEDHEYVVRDMSKTQHIMCLCLQGLVMSPIFKLTDKERRSLFIRVTDNKAVLDKAILDWERAFQTPEIYRRYGNAAFSLVKNAASNEQQLE